MKTRRLVVLLITFAMLFSSVGMAFADDLSLDATATDAVGVAYSIDGTCMVLGIVDNDAVSLTLSGGAYGVTVPGEQATLSGAVSSTTATGGYLHYTLYGMGTSKITVEATEAANTGYAADTLSVKINNIVDAGSGSATLGTGSSTYVGINTTAADLVTAITGTDTYTGTTTAQGAQVEYELSGNPGVSTVNVLYTIVEA
ncbi:hypothetical protein [uncultured Sphaerochaeta sp.]|uniref:hypothetical protein n=1 Tax=uncultured Sphaerochaeta sp. TaxID=886478 RepID=UPI002A0A8C45|nr:hypothetical protein [uncultured Sphaerochaeta sp.]